MAAHPRTSCRKLFEKLEILTVPSQYIHILIDEFSYWKSGTISDKFVSTWYKYKKYTPPIQTCC